jgi:predicted transposase/invertase (TIGR01784 family)
MSHDDRPPHEQLVIFAFGNPRHARGLLGSLLPAQVAARIDWNSLQLESETLIDKNLRPRYSDFIFRLTTTDGSPAYVLLLLEHQSAQEHFMSLRMVEYGVRIVRRWLRHNPGARRFPAVIPIVMYAGDRPWSRPTDLLELTDLDDSAKELLRPHLLRMRFILDDLSSEPTEKREELTTMARLTRAALSQLKAQQPMEFLRQWIGALCQLEVEPGGLSDLNTLTYYIFVRSAPEHREEVLAFMQEHLGEQGRPVIRSIADSFRAEGIEEGRQEGRQEGEAHGLARAVVGVFEARGIPISDEARHRIMACQDTNQLERWLRRAVVANSVSEIFEV